MKQKLTLLLIALVTSMVAWAQVTSITDGNQYTIRLNKNNSYFMGYHYKTTASAAPFKLIDSGETDDDYTLYYIQCPFTGKYLHSTRITYSNSSDISLEWVNDQASATTYSFRPVSAGSTLFRIIPNTSDDGLTAWNSNNSNFNIVPYASNSDLGVWNLMDANGANEINEYELQVTDLNGDFSRTGSGTSDWKDKWDAKASLLSLQLTTSQNNSIYRYDMKYSSSNLQMASSSDKTCYYTMTAPFGCVISGYRISGTTNGQLTLTKGDGSSTVYENGATLTDVGESGILRKSTKFTLQGENKQITGSLFIKVKRLKTISSLSEINRNKCYAIDTKDRGNWATRPDYSYLTRNLATGLNIASDFGDTKQQFAFVYHDGSDDGVDNGSYYIYTISTNKFISANGTSDNDLVVFADKASQSISFVVTGDSDYPVCIEMSNTADLNVRNDSWEAGVTVYGTNGSHKTDDGNKVRIYEVGDFNPTTAEDTWNTADITYTLYYNNTQIGEPVIVENVTAGTAATIPSSMDNGFMTYTYTPERVSSESPTVRIDATWNGPFDIYNTYSTSNHFYTISHNYTERANNYIWTYDGSSSITPQMVATDAYSNINDNRLFCFVGDPYNGLSIYNKAAGSSKTVYSGGQNVAVVMSSENTTSFVPTLATSSSVPSNPSYFALKAKNTSYWLNWNQTTFAGWTSADNGGTCWVSTPSQYPYNFLAQQELDAPYGAVGTKTGLAEDEYVNAGGFKTYFNENPFAYATLTVVERSMVDAILNKLAEGTVITLGDGYYRIVNAYTLFANKPAMYFDSSTGTIKWAVTANNENNVNGIFKMASTGGENAYSIFSVNGQNYISNGGGALSEATPITTTEVASGTAQFSLYLEAGYNNNHHYLHTNGHNSGAGTSGDLTAWNAGANTASAWYLVKVDKLPLTLNDGGDGYYYATVCLPFDVTLSAACAYTLTLNVGQTGLTMSEATNNVPAGTPVMLRHTKGTVTASIANDAATSAPLITTALTGTYTAITDFDGNTNYVLGTDGSKVGFYHWDGPTLSANRAYIVGSGSGVKGYVLSFDDEPDAIKTLSDSPLKGENIYNLAGQRISKMQKGINIVNGKKIMVK